MKLRELNKIRTFEHAVQRLNELREENIILTTNLQMANEQDDARIVLEDTIFLNQIKIGFILINFPDSGRDIFSAADIARNMLRYKLSKKYYEKWITETAIAEGKSKKAVLNKKEIKL